MRYTFESELWRWDARRELWTFVSLPQDPSDEVREMVGDLTGGFGSVRIDVTIGGSRWRTSMFPGVHGGRYVVPVKRAVRDREGLELGDVLTATVELVDF